MRVDAVIQNSLDKNTHIVNGKLKNSSLKLLHWNKGPSFLHKKIDHVKNILDIHKPHIFSLSEANYNKLGARTLGARSRGSKNVTYRQQTTDKKVNTEPL